MHFLCTDKHTHVLTHWPGCTHTDTETRYRYVSGSVAGSVSELRGKTLPLRTTHFVKLNCELRFTISRKATGPGTHTHTHRHIHTCMRYACTQIHAHKRSRQTSRKIVAVSPKQNSNRATTHKMSVELCVCVCECDSNSYECVRV